MEKSLKEIIKEVGKEYEMEDDIINEIIKKLQKEFYIKLKHMKNLSIETWKSLELPINLYYVLNELYQSALAEQQPKNEQNIPKQPEPQIQTNQEKSPNLQPQINIQKNQNQIITQNKPKTQINPNQNIFQNINNIIGKNNTSKYIQLFQTLPIIQTTRNSAVLISINLRQHLNTKI